MTRRSERGHGLVGIARSSHLIPHDEGGTSASVRCEAVMLLGDLGRRCDGQGRHTPGMDTTPRAELTYSDDDVAAATERLREICAGLPEVAVRLSHGAVTFFVRGKRTVCYLTDDHHGDGRLALMCAAPPGVQEDLIESDPVRFFRPPYVGHRGWIGLRLDIDPDWGEVAAIVEEAYRLVAPQTLVRQLEQLE
jgi:hypothetical protein